MEIKNKHNGNKYKMTIHDDDLSSLPDGKLDSGSNIKCVLKTKSSDIIGGLMQATFKVDVEDWPSPVEKEVQMEDASQKYCYIKKPCIKYKAFIINLKLTLDVIFRLH